jgi:hypothetical protein
MILHIGDSNSDEAENGGEYDSHDGSDVETQDGEQCTEKREELENLII